MYALCMHTPKRQENNMLNWSYFFCLTFIIKNEKIFECLSLKEPTIFFELEALFFRFKAP